MREKDRALRIGALLMLAATLAVVLLILHSCAAAQQVKEEPTLRVVAIWVGPSNHTASMSWDALAGEMLMDSCIFTPDSDTPARPCVHSDGPTAEVPIVLALFDSMEAEENAKPFYAQRCTMTQDHTLACTEELDVSDFPAAAHKALYGTEKPGKKKPVPCQPDERCS